VALHKPLIASTQPINSPMVHVSVNARQRSNNDTCLVHCTEPDMCSSTGSVPTPFTVKFWLSDKTHLVPTDHSQILAHGQVHRPLKESHTTNKPVAMAAPEAAGASHLGGVPQQCQHPRQVCHTQVGVRQWLRLRSQV
jgi:hypothetical protein